MSKATAKKPKRKRKFSEISTEEKSSNENEAQVPSTSANTDEDPGRILDPLNANQGKNPKDEVGAKEWTIDKTLFPNWDRYSVKLFFQNIRTLGSECIPELANDLSMMESDVLNFLHSAQWHAQQRVQNRGTLPVEAWIKTAAEQCRSRKIKPEEDSVAIPRVIKLLSLDGVLENHPLPNRCGGVDFPSAYRLLYQAMTGKPLQAVNPATALFVMSSLNDLSNMVFKDISVFMQLKEHLLAAYPNAFPSPVDPAFEYIEVMNKPFRVYKGKKPSSSTTNTVTDESEVKLFSSLSLPDGNTVPMTHVVSKYATLSPTRMDEEDDALMRKSFSYNPLQIPDSILLQNMRKKKNPCENEKTN